MTWEAGFDVFFMLKQAAESMSFLRWITRGLGIYAF
jgi:hypothetical protein